jgi:hypothetical protein
MEEDKDIKAAKESYEELKERLEGQKINYKEYADYMVEMLGEPTEEELKQIRRIPKHKIGD